MADPEYVQKHAERTALSLKGFSLLVLSFQTFGVVYADIGTSPLYTLNGIWPSSGPAPSQEDVIGGISAIIWALTILPLIKYVFICLRFGTTEGEGGTFALFHGLYPSKHEDTTPYHTLTRTSFVGEGDKGESSSSSSFLQAIRWPLLIWALFGASLTMADGILTPAVSVTSAVAGIAVARPEVQSDIIPISIGFLIALFLVQRIGTAKISFMFAPITFIWLALIGVTGIMNIVQFPGILRAFDPSRAVLLFVRTKDYDLLAGVLLALTGGEALFANLGQFNMLSIQIAFGGFVYPCLLLAYLGQGARLIVDGEAVLSNIFYDTIPGSSNGPLFWIIYVFGILATLTASQTLITATFSLCQQIINMKSLPPLRMIYTSETIQGQIYVPFANWCLMVATVVVVAAFKSSQALTNAYGFAVATVMFTTSVLITFQIKYVKHLSIFLALAYFVPFAFFDGLFWGAALKKVPQGAWVPLMLGLLLCIFMTFWTWAKGLEDSFDGRNRKNLRHFIIADDAGVNIGPGLLADSDSEHAPISGEAIEELSDPIPVLYYFSPAKHGLAKADSDDDLKKDAPSESEERRLLPRIQSCAIFHKLTPGRGVPHSFVRFVRQWPALPNVVIFLSVRTIAVARVGAEDRYEISKVQSIPGFYAVTYCLGFRDNFEVEVDRIISDICALETKVDPKGSRKLVLEIRQSSEITTHIIPRYHVISRRILSGKFGFVMSWVRGFLIEDVYRTIGNMFPQTANWLGSADEIIRVGVSATI